MGVRKSIYKALVEGATEGLSNQSLHGHVLDRFPHATDSKIVKASLLALTDSSLRDRNILQTIYALAIKLRVGQTPGRFSTPAASEKHTRSDRGGDTDPITTIER